MNSYRDCDDCIETILTEYPRSFERALAAPTNNVVFFHACRDNEDGHCENTLMGKPKDDCLEVTLSIAECYLTINMRDCYGCIDFTCKAELAHLEERLQEFGSSRVRLAFQRAIDAMRNDVSPARNRGTVEDPYGLR